MTTSPRWQGFERLAERIAKDLVGNRAEVLWNTRLPGQQSGLQRQIDVAIEWSDDQGREYLTVIDCKDWRTPADVNDVGKFASVVRDVGASQGILVCNAGFAKSVHEYARNLGLSLMNLHDAESENWSRNLTVPIVWTNLEPFVQVDMKVWFEAGDQVKIDATTRFRVKGTGEEFTPFHVFEEPWNAGQLPREIGVTQRMSVLPDVALEMQVLADASGYPTWRPAEELGFTYTVNGTSWLGHFQPKRCRGLIDHLDDQAFHVSYLPESEMPGERGADWLPIDDVDLVAVLPRGTYVTSAGFQIVVGSGDVQHAHIRRVGD